LSYSATARKNCVNGAPIFNRLWRITQSKAGCKPALRPALLMPAPSKKFNAKPQSREAM
jgi:hypothetical protein